MKKNLVPIFLLASILSLSSCSILNMVISNVDAKKLITLDELRSNVKKFSSHPYKQATITGKTNGEDFEQEEYTYSDGAWSEATVEGKSHRPYLTTTLADYESTIDSLVSSLQSDFKIYTYTLSGKYKIVYKPNLKENEICKEWNWTSEFDKYGCMTSRYEKYVSADYTTTITDFTIQYQ